MKQILDSISSLHDLKDVTLLIDLVDKIRPSKAERSEEAIEQVQNLIAHLKSYPEQRKAFAAYISELFSGYDPVYLYTSSGILSNRDFFSEFWSRLKHKLLPEASEEADTSILLNQLFHRSDDFVWIEAIPSELWVELLDLLEICGIYKEDKVAFQSLVSSIQVLSHNVATSGLDFVITRKLPHLDKLDSPFLIQNKELTLFVEAFNTHKFTRIENEKFHHIVTVLDDCAKNIEELRRKKNIFGTSLHLTYVTRRLLQQIDRLKLLLRLFHEYNTTSFLSNLTLLANNLIKAENQKTSLTKLINDNVDLLAFEIVEHSARKGGKYIANNSKEYWGYLRASMIGGFVIAFFASFKILGDSLSLSPLGQGLLFSINYALCFVLVQMLGGIIATKQPAMTASAVAQSMDTNDDGLIDNLKGLKDLIIRVSRSQFISFVGNLICALPLAFLLAKGYELVFSTPLVTDYKTASLVSDIHPTMSGALFYACIAGVFLSLSGWVSGYFDNKVVFSRIPYRIKAHPTLNKWFSKERLSRFSSYIERNLGSLAGNISLGFFLGMAGTLGFIMGLPIDIRHVAFSSANFGIALENGSAFSTSTTVIIAAAGILGIGLINFLVSFGMTLMIALKSRKITFGQTKELTRLLTGHFFRAPFDFFIQPGKVSFFRQLPNKLLYR